MLPKKIVNIFSIGHMTHVLQGRSDADGSEGKYF